MTTVGVVATQHRPDSGAQFASQPDPIFQMIHAGCAQGSVGAGQAPKSHVPKYLAAVLELTDTQVAEMDVVAAEACSVLVQTHEKMRNVLTPEQHEKAHALHGGGHGYAMAIGWLKKLHGGQ